MEKQVNFVVLLPLEEIALRKVIVILWNQLDILNQIKCSHQDGYTRLKSSLKRGERLVKNRLSELKIPKLLLKKMIPLIKPIGLEILMWEGFHEKFLNYPEALCRYPYPKFDRKAVKRLSWTSVGTIDYQKTAEDIIRFEMLDVYHLYELACLYCLEDYIPVLWEKLSEDIKERLFNGHEDFDNIHPQLTAYWTCIIKIDEFMENDIPFEPIENLANFYQQAFEKAVHTGNEAATKYFFQKLTREEKEVSLFKTAKDVASKDLSCMLCGPEELPVEKFTNVLCYLLCQMRHEQQMELLKAHPSGVLSSLLEWPWQNLFLDVAELAWDFLSGDDYVDLLNELGATDMILGPNVYLFQNFFQCSPANLKNYFVDQQCLPEELVDVRNIFEDREKFLYKVFKAENTEIIRCVFRNIVASAKVRLVFCDLGLQICHRLIRKDKWHMLKLLIDESMLLETERERLIKDLKPYISANYADTEFRYIIQQLERLFQLPGASSNKRSLEDKVETEAKVLCTK